MCYRSIQADVLVSVMVGRIGVVLKVYVSGMYPEYLLFQPDKSAKRYVCPETNA
jgi:hypothetical protein